MNIPSDIFWEAILVIGGFVFGTLWGHHDKINKRVTYDECSQKRHSCPCLEDVKEISQKLERLNK